MSNWELKEKSTGELITTVEGEAWKTAQKKAFNRLAKKVNLPGFRPGTAPAALVKKQISTQNVLMEAIDDVAGEALSAAIKEHDLWVVTRPSLDIESIDEEKVTFKFIVTVKPEVKLGDYKGLDIHKEEVNVEAADVDAEITRLQERFADLVLKEEGKVENGNTAVIDFEGFKDDVPFEGGKGESYPLVIGSGTFIPGFEEQLIGMDVEETKDINVTFPEEYQVAELAGQPVVFKVTVHEIKEKVLPEVNDELVKQAKVENVETVDAYREFAHKNLEETKTREANQKFENEVLTAIVEAAEVEIPDVMVEEETDNLVRDFEQRLQAQGFGLDQFLQITGNTKEGIREEMSKDAYNKVKVRLVLEAIAAAESLEVSEEDIEKELNNIAEMYAMPLDQVKAAISADAISYDLRIRKALEFVKENVK
ncbi:trigger factor [Amedibacillus dolichus]|uniref:trigger factor n=1 Tax=Amedibacillus dolichus TaxID=31971 RepID=UPI0024330C8B|nr:trigger factor [Amedibacillus dolichus]